VSRDLTWDAIVTVAGRLSRESAESGLGREALVVRGVRRRSPGWVVEGLGASNNWTHGVYEPVRRRRWLSRRWSDLQPVPEAARKIGAFMRERPDIGGR
jgi:hypothetical protein